MKIISNFHDYYDSIQQYGIDNKIVYNRINKNHTKFNTEPNKWVISHLQNEFKGDVDKLYRNVKIENKNPDMEKVCDLFQSICYHQYDFPYRLYDVTAIINGKAYKNYVLTRYESYEETIVSKNITPQEAFDILKDNVEFIYSTYMKQDVAGHKTLNDLLKKKCYFKEKNTSFTSQEELFKIHKELETPVFFIIGDSRTHKFVVSHVPLVHLGFNNLFDGNIEIMAQEISYCLGNVIKNNNEPPIAIDDTIKIEQHGFDKKKSFRHRK